MTGHRSMLGVEIGPGRSTGFRSSSFARWSAAAQTGGLDLRYLRVSARRSPRCPRALAIPQDALHAQSALDGVPSCAHDTWPRSCVQSSPSPDPRSAMEAACRGMRHAPPPLPTGLDLSRRLGGSAGHLHFPWATSEGSTRPSRSSACRRNVLMGGTTPAAPSAGLDPCSRSSSFAQRVRSCLIRGDRLDFNPPLERRLRGPTCWKRPMGPRLLLAVASAIMERRRPRVWVITPELHRHGGTERCMSEEIERWAARFDVQVISMHVDEVAVPSHRHIPDPPGPHLLRFTWWLAANRFARLFEARRAGPPDALVSPGINALDADVIGVHIVFSKYWKRVRAGMLADLRRGDLRALHRILYVSMVKWLEGRVYRGPAQLWAISREDAAELEDRYGRPPGSVPTIPYGVDPVAFSPLIRATLRERARADLAVRDQRVLLLYRE